MGPFAKLPPPPPQRRLDPPVQKRVPVCSAHLPPMSKSMRPSAQCPVSMRIPGYLRHWPKLLT